MWLEAVGRSGLSYDTDFRDNSVVGLLHLASSLLKRSDGATSG